MKTLNKPNLFLNLTKTKPYTTFNKTYTTLVLTKKWKGSGVSIPDPFGYISPLSFTWGKKQRKGVTVLVFGHFTQLSHGAKNQRKGVGISSPGPFWSLNSWLVSHVASWRLLKKRVRDSQSRKPQFWKQKKNHIKYEIFDFLRVKVKKTN